MRLLVLQIENRDDPMLNAFMKMNRDMCQKHGAEYMFLDSSTVNAPPYWWKVFEIDRIMQNRNDIDLIMWLDSDAFLSQWKRNNPIQLAMQYPKANVFVSPDAPPKYSATFCAGSFLIRNNETGRRLVDKWKDLYNKERWTNKNGHWKTEGSFGGLDYEQGSFIEHFLSQAKEWGIIILPYYIFNETNCKSPHHDSISTHLAGHYKENKEDCFHLFQTSQSPLEMFTNNTSNTSTNRTCIGVALVSLLVIMPIFIVSKLRFK
jgi:hypothetical protein